MKHNWEYKKLGDICSIVGRIGFRGYTREDLVEKGNGAISLSPSNIIDGKLNFDDKVSYLSWEKYFESPEIMLAEGDVVFTKTASIGKCALVKHLPVETTLNPQLVVLKNIQCDSSYLTYMLQDKRFQEAVLSKKGGTSIPTISQAFLGSLPVPVPPIETQKQIVAELDKINETIEDCRELLRNLDALAQSLFYDFFGDPIANPKCWKTKPIKSIAPSGESFLEPQELDGKFWLLNLEQVESNSGRILEIEYFPIENIGSSTVNFDEGNVLYSKLRPYLNKVVIPYGRGYCTSELIPLRPNQDYVSREYIAYALRLPEFVKFISAKTGGAKMPRVKMQHFWNFQMPVPPLELQEKFAERIERIEAQKKIVESTIAELQTLLDSRMDYWFN